jgi:intein/homing endonuclease
VCESLSLEKIRDLIGGINPITKIDCSSKRKVLPNAKDMSRLHVFSKKNANDLKNLGVVKRKTKVLRYNGCVPDEYLSSFFRGLVDGDGSIGVDKRGYYWISIASASKEFLEDIQFKTFIWKINTSKCKNGNLIHVLKVQGGQKEIFRFYNWIYENKNDLYLRRKYVKVQSKIN